MGVYNDYGSAVHFTILITIPPDDAPAGALKRTIKIMHGKINILSPPTLNTTCFHLRHDGQEKTPCCSKSNSVKKQKQKKVPNVKHKSLINHPPTPRRSPTRSSGGSVSLETRIRIRLKQVHLEQKTRCALSASPLPHSSLRQMAHKPGRTSSSSAAR